MIISEISWLHFVQKCQLKYLALNKIHNLFDRLSHCTPMLKLQATNKKDIRKLQLTNEFKARQQMLEIKMQACKINDDREHTFKIEQLQINNPQLFWFMINN